MAMSWIDSVKGSKKLSLFSKIGSGKWSSEFKPCMDEFNRLLKENGMPLKFEASSNEKSANVVVSSSSGPAVVKYGGQTFTEIFDGKKLHGYTALLSDPDTSKIVKAYVFLPSDPQMRLPSGKTRPTGVKVMKLIMLHEFIHACGLENKDHSKDDIFNGSPSHQNGSRPDEDRIGVFVKKHYVWFPPYYLKSGTVGKIKSLW